jgi:hypothetical protein
MCGESPRCRWQLLLSTRLLEHCLSCPQAMQKAVKRSGTLSGTCDTSSPSKCARAIKNPQTSHGTAQYVCFSVIPDAPCHLPSMMLLTAPSNRYSVYCKRRPGNNVPGKGLLWCVCFSDVGYPSVPARVQAMQLVPFEVFSLLPGQASAIPEGGAPLTTTRPLWCSCAYKADGSYENWVLCGQQLRPIPGEAPEFGKTPGSDVPAHANSRRPRMVQEAGDVGIRHSTADVRQNRDSRVAAHTRAG